MGLYRTHIRNFAPEFEFLIKEEKVTFDEDL